MTTTNRASSDYFATRRFGEAMVTIISEGSFLWAPRLQAPEVEWRRAIPEAEADGRVRLGFNLAHMRLGDASILIDPGFDDPSSGWQERFAATWPSVTRTPGMAAALHALGIHPHTITHVLVTHAHEDHYAGVTIEQDGREIVRFPRAHYYLGRADWDDNPRRHQPESALSLRLGAVASHGLLQLLAEEQEIVPGITLVPTPGESAGHYVVQIRSAGESFYYLGDLFHLPCEVEHLDWLPAQTRDSAAVRESRARLIAEAVHDRATVVFSHARFPAWGRIVAMGDGTVRWTWAP